VTVELSEQTNDMVMLNIIDDGVGFQTDTVLEGPHPRGLGIIGMQERVKGLGGQFNLFSKAGNGTELFVSVPLKFSPGSSFGLDP
jgi:signal transduction histidine kinase